MWHHRSSCAGAVRGLHLGYIAGPSRYRNFMGWGMPWYSAQSLLDTLLVGRRVGMMRIVCYLRQGSNVFETYWTIIRGRRGWITAIGCLI